MVDGGALIVGTLVGGTGEEGTPVGTDDVPGTGEGLSDASAFDVGIVALDPPPPQPYNPAATATSVRHRQR